MGHGRRPRLQLVVLAVLLKGVLEAAKSITPVVRRSPGVATAGSEDLDAVIAARDDAELHQPGRRRPRQLRGLPRRRPPRRVKRRCHGTPGCHHHPAHHARSSRALALYLIATIMELSKINTGLHVALAGVNEIARRPRRSTACSTRSTPRSSRAAICSRAWPSRRPGRTRPGWSSRASPAKDRSSFGASVARGPCWRSGRNTPAAPRSSTRCWVCPPHPPRPTGRRSAACRPRARDLGVARRPDLPAAADRERPPPDGIVWLRPWGPGRLIASDLKQDMVATRCCAPRPSSSSARTGRRSRAATAPARRPCGGCSRARPRSTAASSPFRRAARSRCTTSARRATGR